MNFVPVPTESDPGWKGSTQALSHLEPIDVNTPPGCPLSSMPAASAQALFSNGPTASLPVTVCLQVYVIVAPAAITSLTPSLPAPSESGERSQSASVTL